MRYVCRIAYDGTNYSGWQIQKNARSVQEELMTALEKLIGERVIITASGRTDSGVHAAAQICHFDCETGIPPEKIADALNVNLPPDISVLNSAIAKDGFDANRSAKKKTYRYSLYFSNRRNPLLDRYSLFIKGGVDLERLEESGKLYVGSHNFKAYCASGSQVKTYEREIFSIEFKTRTEYNAKIVDIFVSGGGFLYNMVRTMVGTMLDFAKGTIGREQIISSLESGERSLVGKTLPANGLTLFGVEYGYELF